MQKNLQITFLLIVVLAFAVTSIFIFPQADDFSYSSRVLEFGFKAAQISEYTKWNGRYMATALLSISPMIWGKLAQYRMLPILLISLMFLSFAFLFREVFQSKLRKGEQWFFALAFTSLTISAMHTTAEGLYWLASSYSYTIAIVFFNVSFACLMSEKKSAAKYALACVSSLCLTGSNETSMVLWGYMLLVMTFYIWKSQRRLPPGFIAVGIVSLIGALIMIKSPGNAIRAGYFEKSHDVVRTVSNALLYSFIDPFKFLTLPLIAFLILNGERIREIFSDFDLKPYKKQLILVLMGLFFITFAPSLWGMGRRPNTRTMNVIVHAYLLLILPVFVVWVKNFQYKKWMNYLVVGLMCSMATYHLASDYVSGKIFRYDEQWREKLSTDGVAKIEKSEAPLSIHFSFIEAGEENKTFLQYKAFRPDFFQ